MTKKIWWIKERDNPQLGTYYVPMGQMTVKDARRYESNALYGSNTMHRFKTRKAYVTRLDELRAAGERVL